jgi:hypothetical protein
MSCKVKGKRKCSGERTETPLKILIHVGDQSFKAQQ